jgi:hypothetical protein
VTEFVQMVSLPPGWALCLGAGSVALASAPYVVTPLYVSGPMQFGAKDKLLRQSVHDLLFFVPAIAVATAIEPSNLYLAIPATTYLLGQAYISCDAVWKVSPHSLFFVPSLLSLLIMCSLLSLGAAEERHGGRSSREIATPIVSLIDTVPWRIRGIRCMAIKVGAAYLLCRMSHSFVS